MVALKSLPSFPTRRSSDLEVAVRRARSGLSLGAAGTLFAPDPAPDRVDEPSDRKSTRLNSSHANISYAVFCLKKKKLIDLNRTISAVNNVTSRISPIHVQS